MTAVALWQFARALDGRRGALAWWAAAAAVAVATHYFAAFVVVPQAVWLVARASEPAARRAALVACLPLALVGAALLPLALEQRSTGNTAYIADVPFGQRAKEVPKKFLVGEQASPGDYGSLVEALKWPAILLALAAAVLLLTRADARERRGGLIAAALAGAGFAMPLVLKVAGLDYLAAYNLQMLWIPAAVAAAAGLGARRAGAVGLAAGGALCAIGVAVVVAFATDEHLQRYDYRDVAELLERPAEPRAIVANPLNSVTPAGRLPGRDRAAAARHAGEPDRDRGHAVAGRDDARPRFRPGVCAERPGLPADRARGHGPVHADHAEIGPSPGRRSERPTGGPPGRHTRRADAAALTPPTADRQLPTAVIWRASPQPGR